MRSLFVGLPLLALAAVLQTTLLHPVRFLDGSFDLVLTIVLAWNLARRDRDAPWWALAGGLLADVLSGGAMGTETFALTTVALLVALTEGRLYNASLPIALLVTLIGTIWYHLLYLFVISFLGQPVPWAEALTLSVLPSALLNLLLVGPLYRIASWAAKLMQPKEIGLMNN